MSTDKHISARTVLDAVLAIKRIGIKRALEQLEDAEPELASFVMESLSTVHQQLLALGGRAKPTQRVLREIESIILVCITSLLTRDHNPSDGD